MTGVQTCALPICFPVTIFEKLQQQLFLAAQQAWVFGGMGSWNDAAPYLAAEQGLEQDYQHLTEQLHRQIRQALMYAVNFAKTSSRTTT